MTEETSRILPTIYKAVDEINLQLPPEKRLSKSPETVLLGSEGGLDSLGFMNFIVAAEKEVETDFGQAITLTEADPFSSENNPFQTLESLASYIATQLFR